MVYKTNKHVERLAGFLPFGASISEIVTELQKEPQKLDMRTRAVEHVEELLEPFPKLVLLTGNAGHGKTYICERLLAAARTDEKGDLKALLRSDDLRTDGYSLDDDGERRLRIHTDLSQVGVQEGADYIASSLAATGSMTVICVNEGRLRSVLDHLRGSSEALAATLLRALDDCINRGLSNSSPDVHVINLNFQSVVAPLADDSGLNMVQQAMREWYVDSRSWTACRDCEAAEGCPIYWNRSLLVESEHSESTGALGETRREGIEDLFLLAELMGQVTTIRDMLMLLAYTVTGGLRCADVHEQLAKRAHGWQHQFAFHRAIFGVNLDANKLKQQPLINRFHSFDPGVRARRSVDDRFIVGLNLLIGQLDLTMSDHGGSSCAIETAEGAMVASTGTETGAEDARNLKTAITMLRRRDFFDLWGPEVSRSEGLRSRAQRVGFSVLEDMVWLKDDSSEADAQRMTRIKRDLVAGLHAIQGLVGGSATASKLSVAHPSFAKWQRSAAMLSGAIANREIKLKSRPLLWDAGMGEGERILTSDTVDWTGREVFLQVYEKELRLDLERFEYIRRAGRGYLSRSFFRRDIRRIANFLARVASDMQSDVSAITIRTPSGQFEYSVSEGLIQ